MLSSNLLCFDFRGNFQGHLHEFSFLRLAGIQNPNRKDLIFRCFSLFISVSISHQASKITLYNLVFCVYLTIV